MSVFSDREQKIIKIIGRKKVTLNEIAVELFKEGNEPFESDIAVGNSVRRIIKKCTHHNLEWNLNKIREHNKLLIKKEKIK